MKGIGWRAGYDKGYDMGTYAPTTTATTKIATDTTFATSFRKHVTDDALEFHRRMARNFFAMAPTLFRDRVHDARQKRLPLVGISADSDDSTPDATETIVEDTLFSPHIIYTYGKSRRQVDRHDAILTTRQMGLSTFLIVIMMRTFGPVVSGQLPTRRVDSCDTTNTTRQGTTFTMLGMVYWLILHQLMVLWSASGEGSSTRTARQPEPLSPTRHDMLQQVN